MVKVEAAEHESNTVTKKTSTELIAFDENHKIQYQGYCKLQINIISKFLFVQPINEDFRDITATFDWKFIKRKNIIFVFAKHVSQDFVLIFKDEEKCQKVLNGIFKKREKDNVEKEILQDRFLIPIFKKISENGPSRMKRIFLKWIHKHDETEKKEYLQLLKKHQKIQRINNVKNEKQEIDINLKNNRKRRHHETVNNDVIPAVSNNFSVPEMDNENRKGSTTKLSTKNTIIINETKFKIVNFKYKSHLTRKLLIFTSSNKRECYEYIYYRNKNLFYHSCDKNVRGFKAVLVQDSDEKDCIKVVNKEHVCAALQYDPEKYMELKIVKKPDYEIMETCATQSKRMLIIFDSSDQSLCYEYSWDSQKCQYLCRGCAVKQKTLAAEICHENTEKEYILILNNQHFCEMRKFDSKKYAESFKYVLSPNFEVQTKIKNGIERKTLIIFYGNERNLCYTYNCRINPNAFYCNGCKKNKKIVSAKICQNNDGEDYVILSNVEHVCSPKEYIPQSKVLILRSPQIKFNEANERFLSKLFIFDSNDPNLCYTFSEARGPLKRFYCLGCTNGSKSNDKKNVVSAYLYKNDCPNDGGEYYVKMMADQKHKCKPEKYDPEKYEMKVLKPNDDYILFRYNGRNSIHLGVFHPENKTFFYKFYFIKANKSFQCTACILKNKCISAKLQQDSDGNEFVVTNQKKHICKPIKYSSIIKPGIIILEKSGLSFEEDEPKKKKVEDVDESRIVRKPNFELHRNIYGVPNRKLIVFKNGDRNSCYIYTYTKSNGQFYCRNCKVSAKVVAEDGEKYVILNEKEHKCKPIEYEPEMKVVEASNYLIFNRDDKSKPTKLILFISAAKDFCYEYTFDSHSKLFLCCGCTKNKKKISAKLLCNEECIQLSKNDHVCEPKKFILEEFQPKIIPENGFKLCPNKNGKPNSKLFLFDSEKNDFCYEYLLGKKNLFTCTPCIRLKKAYCNCKNIRKRKWRKISSTFCT